MMEPDGAPLALSFDVCCNKMCMLCRKHYAKLLLMVSIWFHANDDNYSQILFAMSTNKMMCKIVKIEGGSPHDGVHHCSHPTFCWTLPIGQGVGG
jgi:uncharacterized Fe-S cluster-containing radical SAM superfamily protein